MGILIGFLVAIAAIGLLFYLLVIYREIPGAVEQRLGELEAIPADVNKWKPDDESEAGKAAAAKGLLREVRLYFDEKGGALGHGKFVRQARYRNRATNAITSVEPDEPVRRKRVKKS
jgi:hypothetical protein